ARVVHRDRDARRPLRHHDLFDGLALDEQELVPARDLTAAGAELAAERDPVREIELEVSHVLRAEVVLDAHLLRKGDEARARRRKEREDEANGAEEEPSRGNSGGHAHQTAAAPSPYTARFRNSASSCGRPSRGSEPCGSLPPRNRRRSRRPR